MSTEIANLNFNSIIKENGNIGKLGACWCLKELKKVFKMKSGPHSETKLQGELKTENQILPNDYSALLPSLLKLETTTKETTETVN